MRDHELELIAALAEGRLEDETEARALIESSPEHRAEFEAQEQALSALSSMTSAELTDLEKAGLRRDVWTQLRAPAASAPARQPWYYRWAPVAAGLFMMVGLIAVLNNQGGPDGDTPVAAEFDAETSSTSAAGESAGGEDREQGDGGAAPEAEETPTSVATAEAIEIEDLVAADLSRALTATDNVFYSTEADEIRASDEADTPADETTQSRLTECVDQSGLSGYSIVGAYPVISEDEFAPEDANPYIVVKPEGDDLATAPLAFVDTISCEVIYVDK